MWQTNKRGNSHSQAVNICDSFQGRMYQSDCNQVGHSRQLLCLLTSKISPLHAAVAPTSIKTPQKSLLFDRCRPPTCSEAGTQEIFSPLPVLIYLYRRLTETHNSCELRKTVSRGEAQNTDRWTSKGARKTTWLTQQWTKWNKTCSHSYCTKNLLPDVWQRLEAPLGVRAASMRQLLSGRRAICALSFLCSQRRSLILVHAVKAVPERWQVQTLRCRWLTCLNLALASFSFILPWATR